MEENYPDIDLRDILDLEIEDLENEDIIKDKIGILNMWYCNECGYFDYDGFVDNCPNCNMELKYPYPNFIEWSNDDNLKHLSSLMSDYQLDDPNLGTIISAIFNAKYFIHIATESLDRFFAGMLVLKAKQGCDVKALFWRQKDNHLQKLIDHCWEIDDKIRRLDGTHQKIIIVDGFVAFKGSANATFNGWIRDTELRETETNLSKIKMLNTKYFAYWYDLGKTLH